MAVLKHWPVAFTDVASIVHFQGYFVCLLRQFVVLGQKKKINTKQRAMMDGDRLLTEEACVVAPCTACMSVCLSIHTA